MTPIVTQTMGWCYQTLVPKLQACQLASLYGLYRPHLCVYLECHKYWLKYLCPSTPIDCALYGLGRLELGYDSLLKSVALSPKDGKVWLTMSQILSRQHKDAEATEKLLWAISANPTAAESYNHLAASPTIGNLPHRHPYPF